ncbi:MAG TPA: glycoside hydrolase family 65, partial [Chloroflexota bacterium]|nr:glycoside hydrolase family 65 [Chloroflexota bacterium]
MARIVPVALSATRGRVFSRRVIAALGVGSAAAAAANGEAQGSIHRRALVRRHNPVVRSIDPRAPLSVGNGELAMTVDVTGLQSIPDAYEVPLNVLAQWAWHSNRPHLDHPQELRLTPVETHGRTVHYPLDPEGQQVTYAFHRANPHRLHLARIALQWVDGLGVIFPLDAGDVRAIEQRLDLWTGLLTSRFTLAGEEVRVETCCHPELDVLAVSVTSPLVESGRLAISLDLPAPDSRPADRRPPPTIREDLVEFRSEIVEQAAGRASLRRRVDEDGYDVLAAWAPGGTMDRVRQHVFAFRPARRQERLEVALRFLPDASSHKDTLDALPAVREIQAASQTHWSTFWSRGGALEVAGSDDPRAMELERRVVLSQYQTAINCAGSLPPAESGLYSVSWHGKFHLEMHWWHAAHFAL